MTFLPERSVVYVSTAGAASKEKTDCLVTPMLFVQNTSEGALRINYNIDHRSADPYICIVAT